MNMKLLGLKVLLGVVVAGSFGTLLGVYQPKAHASASSLYQDNPARVCVDGIVHYKWVSSRTAAVQAVTVAVTPEGKPRTCNGQ